MTVDLEGRRVIEVRVVRDIARPAGEVFAFVSDVGNNSRWQNGMRSCVWTSDPPVGVGSTYDQEASFPGRTIHSKFEVVDFEPGAVIAANTVEGSFPITFRRAVEPVDEATAQVAAVITGDSSGFFKIAEPLMRTMVRRSIEGDYDRLEALLEAGS